MISYSMVYTCYHIMVYVCYHYQCSTMYNNNIVLPSSAAAKLLASRTGTETYKRLVEISSPVTLVRGRRLLFAAIFSHFLVESSVQIKHVLFDRSQFARVSGTYHKALPERRKGKLMSKGLETVLHNVKPNKCYKIYYDLGIHE